MITLGWRWALFALGCSVALIDELTSVSEGTRAPKRTPPRLGCVTGDLHELPLGRQRYSVNRLANVVPTVWVADKRWDAVTSVKRAEGIIGVTFELQFVILFKVTSSAANRRYTV